MRRYAVRTGRWFLWAVPAMVLGGLIRPAEGPEAGLALWMCLGGLFFPAAGKGLKRKQRVGFHRLFLCFSLTALLYSLLSAGSFFLPPGWTRSLPSRALTYAGASFLSLSAGVQALRLPWSAKTIFASAAALFLLWLLWKIAFSQAC